MITYMKVFYQVFYHKCPQVPTSANKCPKDRTSVYKCGIFSFFSLDGSWTSHGLNLVILRHVKLRDPPRSACIPEHRPALVFLFLTNAHRALEEKKKKKTAEHPRFDAHTLTQSYTYEIIMHNHLVKCNPLQSIYNLYKYLCIMCLCTLLVHMICSVEMASTICWYLFL